MDMPINPFKRAIKAGRQQIGLWSSLSSHLTVEILAGSGLRLAADRHRALAERLPMVFSQLQAADGGTRTHRAAAVVRPGHDQALAGHRHVHLPDPVHADGGEAHERRRGDALPAGGRRGFASASRATSSAVKDYFTSNEETLRDRADRDPRGARQSRSDRHRSRASTACSSGPADLSAGMGHSASRRTRTCKAHPARSRSRRAARAGKAGASCAPDREGGAACRSDMGCLRRRGLADIGSLAAGTAKRARRQVQEAAADAKERPCRNSPQISR